MENNGIKRTTLVVAAMSSFLAPFMGSAANVAIPSISKEFGLDVNTASWIATSYLLAAAMFLVPFGRIADIYGRKKIFVCGIAVYAAASALSATADSALMLIIFRLIHGIGSSMVFGTGIAILTSVFPPEERGRALGINVAAVYSGLSLGPLIGGVLTHNLGWRSLFWFNVPLCVIIIALVLWKMKGEWAEAKGEKFDIAGSFLYSLSLVCVMYGFSILPSAQGKAMTLSGVAGILAFIVIESRTKYPVMNVALFRDNMVFLFSNIAAFAHYSASFAVGFLLSLYLHEIKGLNPEQTGIVLVSQPIIMTVVSPFAGRLSDKTDPRAISSAGMAVTTAGLVLLAFITTDTSIGYITVVLLLLGLGFALFSSPNTNAIMGSVEKKYFGIAAAATGTMRLTGQMFSMGIATMVFALYMGKARVTPENFLLFTQSLRVIFIVFAILCFCGIFASLARGKTR